MEQRVYRCNRSGVTTQYSGEIGLTTSGRGFTNITADVVDWLASGDIHDGVLTVFVCHTSASLTIQENADPDVCADLVDALDGFAPRDVRYRHSMEGPDDMPAHIKTMITDVSIAIPVRDGKLVLGTWQGLYLIEHRDRPHKRKIALHFIGS